MARPSPGKFVAIIDLHREAGRNKIAKTMAVVGRKPQSGNTAIRFEVINGWNKDVTVDFVDWSPRSPFTGNQQPVKVKKGHTRQIVRKVGTSVDRGTFSYVLKINNTKFTNRRPWVIIF